MNQHRQTARVGAAAVLCALLLRLWAAGVPEKLAAFLTQPRISSFLVYLETGRTVRFLPSLQVFSPDFVESPPAVTPKPEEVPLPVFSGEEAVELYNPAGKEVALPQLLTEPLDWDLTGPEPRVLILHTHSTESYSGESYRATARWRTLEEDHNMLSIGQALAQALARQGITALQDRQIHDYPSYNGSYAHARKAVEEALETNPGIALVLDLHRDASGDPGQQLRTLAQLEGTESAQLMVVIGANHDGFTENLSLGAKLHAQLEAQAPGIMRPLQLRYARYNQDLHPHALLIEVGAAGNTRQEALTAAEQLALAIAALARGANPQAG